MRTLWVRPDLVVQVLKVLRLVAQVHLARLILQLQFLEREPGSMSEGAAARGRRLLSASLWLPRAGSGTGAASAPGGVVEQDLLLHSQGLHARPPVLLAMIADCAPIDVQLERVGC